MKNFDPVSIILLAAVLVLIALSGGIKIGLTLATDDLQKQAIERGTGKWEISKDGKPQFIWMYCQNLETKDKK